MMTDTRITLIKRINTDFLTVKIRQNLCHQRFYQIKN